MFEFVSGANFFGEIVEWSGFAVASWSFPALAFALFTALNIGPRAVQHHRWDGISFRTPNFLKLCQAFSCLFHAEKSNAPWAIIQPIVIPATLALSCNHLMIWLMTHVLLVIYIVTCDSWLVTRDLWLMTCDLTCDSWLVTHDLWLMTCDLTWLMTWLMT